MSGLCDLHDYPADQWIAIATAVRDSLSMPAVAASQPSLPPPGHAAAGSTLSKEILA